MTIFIDASALTAIIVEEVEAKSLKDRLDGTDQRITSPIALWETIMAVARIKKIDVESSLSEVDRYLDALKIEIRPIEVRDAVAAARSHARYGKGMGHPAQLNMGDCFAYACAKSNGAALLYKGDDFARTDLA